MKFFGFFQRVKNRRPRVTRENPRLEMASNSRTQIRLVSSSTQVPRPRSPKGVSPLAQQLVIFPELPKIAEMIRDNQRCAVVAATGSGKSLGLPYWIAAVMNMRVWISVPTRAAAYSLHQRQIEICAGNGIKIGYAAKGDKHYDENCQIVYATTGHWRRKFMAMHQKDQSWKLHLGMPDFFILDEVHTGTCDNDVLLAMFDQLHNSSKLVGLTQNVPSLILATATYDSQKYPEIPHKEVPVKSFPVETLYHHRDYSMKDEADLWEDIADKVAQEHRNDPELAEGHFLIFADGAPEVDQLVDLLYRRLSHEVSNTEYADDSDSDVEDVQSVLDENLLILPAYSGLQREDLRKIFEPVPAGVRMIVVATNVAETSLTIPGVGYVFDSMLEKSGGTSPSGGSSLVTQRIYRDSADQRKGRTGRDRAGRCYRFMTANTFSTIPATRPPEIQRIPLDSVLLEVLSNHFEPVQLLKNYVSEERIESCMKLLHRLEVISEPIPGEIPTVHESGTFVSRYPLSVRNGCFLYWWLRNQGDIYQGVVLASLIECFGPSYIWWPNHRKTSQEQMTQFHHQMMALYGSENELAAYCKVWNLLMAKVRGMNADYYKISNYCRQKSLNHKKILELISTIRQCLHKHDPRDIRYSGFNEEAVVKSAISFLKKAYSDRVYERYGLFHPAKYMNPISRNLFSLDTKRNLSKAEPNSLVSLAEITLVTAKGTVAIISINVPCF